MKRMTSRSLRKTAVFLAVIGCLFGACAIVDHVSEDGVEGYLSFGFEESAFRPCGIDEIWWVEPDPSIELLEAYADVAGTPLGRVRVYSRLVGSRTGVGEYGHLGFYDRTFTVSRIVTLRAVAENDCVWPGDLGD